MCKKIILCFVNIETEGVCDTKTDLGGYVYAYRGLYMNVIYFLV